jgi:threonine/homoserine/homoserine lactone efflux protein
MTLDQAVAFFTFSLVAAITPGPSNVMITATSSIAGIRRGFPCALGAAAGMAALLFCSQLGIGRLLMGFPVIMNVMKWAGAVLLLWLAWKIATAGAINSDRSDKVVGFWGAAGFQWLNPKGWLVALSAASVYGLVGSGNVVLAALAFAAVFFAAAFPSCLAWLVLGAMISRLLRNERSARIFNIVMGLLLAASVVVIVF